MAISIREVLTDEGTSGGVASVTTGSGTLSTDLLVAFGMSEYYSLGTYGPPTGGGWTERVTGARSGDDSKLRVWTKTAPGGATTIELNGIADEGHAMTVVVLAGADTSDPVDASAGAAYSGSGTSHPAPSCSPTSSDAFLLCAVVTAVFGGGGSFTPPSGMTERAELVTTSGGDTRYTVATEQLSASGATGAKSFTYTNSGVAGAGVSVAINTAGGGDTIAAQNATHGHTASAALLVPSHPYKVADRATDQNKTNSTSTVVDMAAAGSIAVGNVLIARISMNNSGTDGAATTVGISDPRGNTWTVGAPANQDPSTVNSGITCRIAYCVVANGYTNGDDLTFNYGDTTIAEAIVVEEWANLDTTSLVAVAQTTATGASTTPSVSRTPTAAGQLFYGALAIEGIIGDTYTQDSDTTDGTWATLTSLATSGSTDTTNVVVRGASKLVTGTSAQTWNPTITSRDWAAVAIVFNAAPTGVAIVPADASHGHAADSPALTQAHALTAADAAHGHTADSPVVTQVHEIAAQSASHAHTADEPTVTQAHGLIAADASHGHTADAAGITQAHALVASDAAHVHTATAAALTQVHGLVALDAVHAQTAEAPALTGTHALVAADAQHGHSADEPTLAQVADLAPAAASHSHTADAPGLTQLHSLVAAAATHAQTADAPDLIAGYAIAAADATHGHTAGSAALTGTHEIVGLDAQHTHTADGAPLSQAHTLTPADADHAHTADSPALTGGAVLAAQDASHGHTASAAGLTQTHALAALDAVHAHTADGAAPTQAHDLTALDASHSHTAGEASLSGGSTIATQDATHGHTAGSPTLSQAHLIVVSAASHAHTADLAAITQLHLLAALSASHLHTADVATLTAGITSTPAARTAVVPGESRTVTVLAGDRTATVPAG